MYLHPVVPLLHQVVIMLERGAAPHKTGHSRGRLCELLRQNML